MADGRDSWAQDDVPSPPYFHGSRRKYLSGDLLLTDVVNNMEGEEDNRLRCFATTSLDDALRWAYRRGIVHGGDTLYVYEVEMIDPEVDVNAHPHGPGEVVTSVMSPHGRVLRVAAEVPVSEYPGAIFG